MLARDDCTASFTSREDFSKMKEEAKKVEGMIYPKVTFDVLLKQEYEAA